jgi:Mrp family chromosome partitioning ATPase/capsular polysaccharide biosynthesis protein
MTLEHYWTVLLKQWKLILGCFLLVGLGTLIASKLTTPLYQATALVQVTASSSSNSQTDYTNLLASDQLVQTEAELATSGPVLSEVASHFPGVSPGLVAKEASSSPTLNTQLFQIVVLDPDPRRAAALANDIAQTLIKQETNYAQQQNTQNAQQIQQDLNTTSQQISVLSGKIANLQSTGGHQAEVVVLESQLNSLQQHYTQWQTLLAQLELNEAENDNFLRLVQTAQPSSAPVRPNIPLNTGIGFLAGLFLGILAAILVDRLDTRVRTPEALNELLSWPIIGTIWRDRVAKAGKRAELVDPQGRDANVESYRILRTNIGFSSIDKPLRLLMVTSAMPGDGKSTVAANLAIFMAKAGKNTLLVDADLRRPVQHQIFNLPPDKKGLSNAVLAVGTDGARSSQFMAPTPRSGGDGRDKSGPYAPIPRSGGVGADISRTPADISRQAIFPLEEFAHAVGVPNLRVMPSGPLPPNPSELLDSKSMQRFYSIVADCGADVVIFDAPPIRGLSDASIIASKVDGTMLVVDSTRATRGQLRQVKTLLAQAGAGVIGCVVNKQRRSRHDSSYSYYYYYRQDEQKNGAFVAGGRGILSGAKNDMVGGRDKSAPTQSMAEPAAAARSRLSTPWKGGADHHGR